MEKSNPLNKIDKEKAIKIAHIVYAVLLIALAVAVGILFIVNVVDIYDNGAISPFTIPTQRRAARSPVSHTSIWGYL